MNNCVLSSVCFQTSIFQHRLPAPSQWTQWPAPWSPAWSSWAWLVPPSSCCRSTCCRSPASKQWYHQSSGTPRSSDWASALATFWRKYPQKYNNRCMCAFYCTQMVSCLYCIDLGAYLLFEDDRCCVQFLINNTALNRHMFFKNCHENQHQQRKSSSSSIICLAFFSPFHISSLFAGRSLRYFYLVMTHLNLGKRTRKKNHKSNVCFI